MEALPQATQMAGGDEGLGVLVRRALFLSHLGRHAEVMASLPELVTSLTENSAPIQLFAMLLETANMEGNRQSAEILMESLSTVSHLAVGGTTGHTCPARHLGAAAALLGEPEKARAYYHQALDVCAKIRFRPEIALTRLQMAELLLEQYPDEREEALEHLDFAIGEFRDRKMQPSLERALRHREILKA